MIIYFTSRIKFSIFSFCFEYFLINLSFVSDGEYTTFAEVIIDHRGFRRLMHSDGFAYGVHHEYKDGATRWRCTLGRVKGTGKRLGCRGSLRTKKINGYEMIKDPHVIHDH